MSVAPAAKYQLDEPAVAQGADARPNGLFTSCSTATAPALTSTMAPIQGAPLGTSSSTTRRLSGPMVAGTRMGDPPVGTRVTTAVAVAGPALAIMTAPGAVPCGWPAPE